MATGAPSQNTAGNPVAQRRWSPYRQTEYGTGREETQTDRDRRRIEEHTNAINAANRANRPAQNLPGSGQMSGTSTPTNFSSVLAPRLSAYTNPTGGSAGMGTQGIANPPSTGIQGPQSRTIVQGRNPGTAINPYATGNEKKNRDIYKPSDFTVTTPQQTNPGVTSRVVPQAESDFIFGHQFDSNSAGGIESPEAPIRNPNLAGTGQPIITPYGQISSRQAGPIESQGTALDATRSPNGVIHPQASDPVTHAQARIALQQQHPNIFVAGTPENKAFTEYAQQHGEAEAHRNAGALMASIAPGFNQQSPVLKNGQSTTETKGV